MVDGAESIGWDTDSLAKPGFKGFTSFAGLSRDEIPRDHEVYMVLRPDPAPPRFA